MSKVETVEEFLAKGGKVTKCRTYGYKKHSSIPMATDNIGKVGKGGRIVGVKQVNGFTAQELLDAAIGTEHEADMITFLEQQGYEVE